MTPQVFFDLDECLIHSAVDEPKKYNFVYSGDFVSYYTIVRNRAVDCVSLARQLFGEGNVKIMTVATLNYANTISGKAGFNFHPDNIISREHLYPGLSFPETFENVLIDNLPADKNKLKCSTLNIKDPAHYLNVEEFVGQEEDDYFYQTVSDFLTDFRNNTL